MTIDVVDDKSEKKYIHAKATGTYLFEGEGSIEFLVRAEDSVVTYKASGYGASKGFFDDLRKRSDGVFVSSGDQDDMMTFSEGNGIVGQLKAFYGLQSGQGFENVFDE